METQGGLYVPAGKERHVFKAPAPRPSLLGDLRPIFVRPGDSTCPSGTLICVLLSERQLGSELSQIWKCMPQVLIGLHSKSVTKQEARRSQP